MLKRLRLPITVVAALAVAEAAVFLMRPRDPLEPVDVAAQTYFSPAYIERAEHFRNGQLLLYGASLVIEIGAARVGRAASAARPVPASPVLAGAAVAAGLSVAVTVATLPVSLIARQRAKDVGLVTQDWVGYAGDVVKGTAIQAVIVGSRRRTARLRHPPVRPALVDPGATVLVIAFGVISTYATPIVIDPLFNRFDRLGGPLRAEVLELADKADVKVGQVYEMDASRRTTAANAYVNGIGSTKRVVIYDTLLKDFPPRAVRGVVAHELGHVHYRDVPHGLLYLADRGAVRDARRGAAGGADGARGAAVAGAGRRALDRPARPGDRR